MVKLKSHKTGKYLCNWSNKCNGKDASFLLKTGWSCDINRLSLIFKWSSELLETSTWKSSKETGCLQISVWSAYNHSYICLKKKLYLIKIKLFCLSIETTFLYLFEKKIETNPDAFPEKLFLQITSSQICFTGILNTSTICLCDSKT